MRVGCLTRGSIFVAASTMRRCSRTIVAGTPARPYSEPCSLSSADLTNERTRGHLMPSDSASGKVMKPANQRERTSLNSLVYQGIAQPLIQRVGEKSDTP